jgi:hypothetical protein
MLTWSGEDISIKTVTKTVRKIWMMYWNVTRMILRKLKEFVMCDDVDIC